MVEAAVKHFRELLGDRLGDEKSLEEWARQQFAFCHSHCHFCGQHAEELRIDWQDIQLIGLCCVACWDLRRQLPYEIVKTHSVGLKSGEKKFCIGEFHESNDERVLAPQLFEERFSICKQCFTKQLRKRRVKWEEYVESWTDENSWQNVMASGPPVKPNRRMEIENKAT